MVFSAPKTAARSAANRAAGCPLCGSGDVKGNSKAAKAAKALTKGTGRKSTTVRTKVHFYRPKTLRLARKPKVVRKSAPRLPHMDQFRIIKHPLTTESAMKKVEDNNTLVFIVDIRANKMQIKDAVSKMYDIKALKVNTLIR